MEDFILMEGFILRILIAAIGVALVAGFLGCFVIWKRLAYFSDSISHSALIGISLGIVSGIGIHFGLFITSIIFAILVVILENRKILSNDAILGVFSHISLAVGIIALGFVGSKNIDYFAYLFGDILSIGNQDIFWIYIVMIIVVATMMLHWNKFIFLTLDYNLAQAEGINKILYDMIFMLLIALTVSVSIVIVGVLLITALLIIPPAIARVFSTSPISMVLLSLVISLFSVCFGIYISIQYDLATGPMITIILGVIFLFSQLIPKKN